MSEPTAYPQQQTTPVCPRHPDRVSYVRCQRCGRPVCPECQRPAAVGVQCVDCVKQQAKTVRTTRTVFGGNVTDTPVVSYAIIAICVLVFVLQTARPVGDRADRCSTPVPRGTEPWRFLTAAFAHGGITHILFNMLALWMVGAQYLERLLGGPAVCRGLPRQRDRRLGRLPAVHVAAADRLRPARRRASGAPGRWGPRARCSACSARCSCSTGTSAGPRRACTRRSASTP